MESTRDIRRMIEKEIKKGSAPLTFDHIEYPKDALQGITSESKLKEVLVYLFRTAEFENLANDMTRNNVYTEHHLIKGDSFHRRNNVMERNANYIVKPHAVGGGKCGLFSETLQLNCGMISAAAGC